MSERIPHLDTRLSAAAEYVRQGHNAADIGCDHGYLSGYLAASGRCLHVYACDLRQDPLEKAKRNCSLWADKITFRLGSGLQVMQPDEADDIVIAGMGAETILEILDAAPWVFDEKYNLVLVPATKHSLLRQGLAQRGFALLDETLCTAAGRWYAVMNARYNGEKWQPDGVYCVCGKTTGQAGAEIYLEKQLVKIRKYRRGLRDEAQAAAVDKLIHDLEEML